MVEIVVPVVFFGLLFTLLSTIIKNGHERRMAQLKAKAGDDPGEVKALKATKAELEQRVQNLESIVCNVDFELNAKINRLATRSALPAAPGEVTSAHAALAQTEHIVAGLVKPGQTVAGRFKIEQELGRGGMGAVFLARDETLGESVALKVIAGFGTLDPAAAERLRREASAARRINHPNVVRLHDMGEDSGLLFLSMEYVAGQSLRDLIARHGVLPVGQVRSFASQIAHGLQAAHEAGVVHRDLKPGNLLIDPGGHVKIIDFGLARLPHLEGMTATNMIVGTPEYMAPEQIRGGKVDTRTDVYALGAVVYHALTGRPPFSGETPIAVGFAHVNEAVRKPSALRSEVGDAWDTVVLKAMAKEPNERYATMAELRDALPPGTPN